MQGTTEYMRINAHYYLLFIIIFEIIIQDTSEYTNGINTCTILLLLLIHTHDIIARQNTLTKSTCIVQL